MKVPKVSIIIPVYNVEKYLRRCVDSVLNQTYKNLEIILVDDGSPDGCPAICDEYTLQDKRIKVIHKGNGGSSSARNAALNSDLLGEFVTFLDSDDWIEPDMYEYMLSLVDNYDADVVEIKLQLAFSDNEKHIQSPEQIQVFWGEQILNEYMEVTTRKGGFSCCIDLFKKEIIGNVRFREGKKCEDMDFKYLVLSQAKRYVKSNQVKYYYFQHGISISTGGLTKKDYEIYEASEILYNLTKNEDYGTIRKNGKISLAKAPLSILAKMAYYGIADNSLSKKEVLKMWMPLHRKNLLILINSHIRISRKILSVLLAINYTLTEYVLKFVKKIGYVKL